MNNRGFSLIELMITVAVLAILLTIGIPSFQSQFERSRFSAVQESLLTTFSEARAAALVRGTSVEVCAGTGASCSDSNDWSGGWLLVTTTTPVEVLRAWDGPSGSSVNSSTAKRVRYGPDGSLRKSDGTVPGTNHAMAISYGSCSANIQILPTGVVRLTGGCP